MCHHQPAPGRGRCLPGRLMNRRADAVRVGDRTDCRWTRARGAEGTARQVHRPRRPCWTAPWATPPPAASLPGMPVGLSRGSAWMAKNGPEPVRGWRFWTILPKTALCRPVLNPSGAERRRRQGVQICPLFICRLAARHPLGDVPGRCRRHPSAGPLPVGNSRALGAD